MILVAGLVSTPPGAAASDDTDELALSLIDRFYDSLAPDNTELAGFLGEGFQIIGSDGLRFDRQTYLTFPKAITSYDVTGLVAARDGNVLTATFEIGYEGAFEGVARTVPRLARLAVFHETEGSWKLQALAALGTGQNDIADEAPEIIAHWRAAIASGEPERIRPLASPDFQLQRPNGEGLSLADYIKSDLGSGDPAIVEDLVATSFSNTMVARYKLRIDGAGGIAPRMTVFQRIDGKWRAAAEAEYSAIE